MCEKSVWEHVGTLGMRLLVIAMVFGGMTVSGLTYDASSILSYLGRAQDAPDTCGMMTESGSGGGGGGGDGSG